MARREGREGREGGDGLTADAGWFAAALLGGLYGGVIAPGTTLGLFGWMLFLVAAVSFAGIVVHEAGHAIVARLLGFRVLAVVLGAGPPVASLWLGGTRVELRLIPSGGVTVPATLHRRAYRLRLSLVLLAGPAATAALLWWGWVLIHEPAWEGSVLPVVLMLHGVLGLATNLVPRRVVVQGTPTANDGMLLVNTLRQPAAEIDAVVAHFDDTVHAVRLGQDGADAVGLARAAIDGGDTSTGALRRYSEALLFAHRYPEAVEVCRRLVTASDLDDGSRCLAANNLAWAAVMTRDPALVAEADDWSADALATGEALAAGDATAEAWLPSLRSTRGAALVAAGRPAEALALLEGTHAVRAADKAALACWRALAAVAVGNRWLARQELDAARKADPTFPLLGEVRDVVAAADGAADGAGGGALDAPNGEEAGAQPLRSRDTTD